MLDQAVNRTASVTVGDVKNDGGSAERAGHRDQQRRSQVPVRRRLPPRLHRVQVLDVNNKVLWSSGRTNGAGVIVDDEGAPIAGELWWKNDCSARIEPQARIHQPHYQVITRQDQAQIYQELVAAPPDAGAPVCGVGRRPDGPAHHQLPVDLHQGEGQPPAAARLPDLEQRIADLASARRRGLTWPRIPEPVGVGDDPDYRTGGGDSLDLSGAARRAAGKASRPRCRRRSTIRRRRRSTCRTGSAPRTAPTPSGCIT